MAEAITAGGLDWEIQLVPLVTADKSPAAPARAVRRAGDEQVLGVVDPGYHALQNRAALQFFQPFLDAGLATLNTGGWLAGGRKVWLLARIEREPVAGTVSVRACAPTGPERDEGPSFPRFRGPYNAADG